MKATLKVKKQLDELDKWWAIKWWARSWRNFKPHYINIVKTTCGQPPQELGNPKDQANDIASVDAIISNYKNHPSINQIRKKFSNPKIHSLPEAKKEEINILIKRQNPKKAIGPDWIPFKITKLSADVIDKHLINILNTDLECSCFSENVKIASVKPIYKKESKL